MDTKTLKQTTAALAALDFTAKNERITELEAQISELQTAMDRGEARCTEISQALVKGGRPDARAIADALLSDASPISAAAAGPNREAMEEERTSLREGIRNLRHRREDIEAELATIQGEAMSKVAGAAKPLVDEIMRKAREAAETLPALYAALYAVNFAARTARGDLETLRDAIDAISGSNRLLAYRKTEEVPCEIVTALRALADKGPALRDARFVTSTPMP